MRAGFPNCAESAESRVGGSGSAAATAATSLGDNGTESRTQLLPGIPRWDWSQRDHMGSGRGSL